MWPQAPTPVPTAPHPHPRPVLWFSVLWFPPPRDLGLVFVGFLEMSCGIHLWGQSRKPVHVQALGKCLPEEGRVPGG